MPTRAESLLAKVLVVPGFLAKVECQSLLAALAGAREQPTAIVQEYLRPLEARFTVGDFARPESLFARVQTAPAARAVLGTYMDPEALGVLRGVRSMEAATDEIGALAIRALDRAVRDPALFVGLAALVDVPRDGACRRELDDLLDEGILAREGDRLAVADAGDPARQLALAWFHIRVLEELVLGDGLRKINRALDGRFAAAVRAGSLVAGPVADALRDRPALAARLDSRRPSDALFALHELFADPGLRAAFLDRTGADDPEPGDTRASCEAVQRALHRLDPALFAAPAEHSVASGIREARLLDASAVRDRLDRHVRRLSTEVVGPRLGVTVLPAYEGPRVLRYRAGGRYLPHVDSCHLVTAGGREVWVKRFPRDVSVLLYLSDASAFTGGRLTFPDLGLAVEPQQGLAVAFPSDHRYRHAVEAITDGTRCVVAAWLTCAEGGPVGEPFQETW